MPSLKPDFIDLLSPPRHTIFCWMLIRYVNCDCYSGFLPTPSFYSVGNLIPIRL